MVICSIEEKFREALLYVEAKYGYGFQAKVAKAGEVNPPYLNDIIKGRKGCPEDIRRKIISGINKVYQAGITSYDQFLSLGELIISGKDPKGYEYRVSGIRGDWGWVEKGLPNIEPAPDKEGDIPLISWVQAGEWSEIIDNFHPGDAEDWVSAFKKVGKNSFALRIKGSSMEPMFAPGDIVIIDPTVQPETGRFVVAKIDSDNGENGEATFKQFIRDGNQIFLKPLNDMFPLIDMTGKDFKIIGCAVQKATLL